MRHDDPADNEGAVAGHPPDPLEFIRRDFVEGLDQQRGSVVHEHRDARGVRTQNVGHLRGLRDVADQMRIGPPPSPTSRARCAADRSLRARPTTS
jgi:hypothetical protein